MSTSQRSPTEPEAGPEPETGIDAPGDALTRNSQEEVSLVSRETLPSSTTAVISEGEVLAERYRVFHRLGKGGMGEVYLAQHIAIGRMVAIKTLNAGGDPEMLQRFRNEAAAAGKLRHRNIIIIHDFGEQDGEPYIVMELLDGEDLQRVMQNQRPLTLLERMQIMEQVAEGLDHAHRNGVVHRDVKPANLVVVTVDGHDTVKIVDLGIAERIDAQPDLLSGTPEYIAPEQAEFRPVDVRSDIYALGCCAYELLTGKRLVDGRSAFAKINVHIEGVKPEWPRERRIPYVLRRLVERCLARQPQDRPATMAALELELDRVAAALARMEERKTEPMRLAYRPATQSDLGRPCTAANQAPPTEPDAPMWRLGRSWSSLASTLLARLGRPGRSAAKQLVSAGAAATDPQRTRRAR